MAHYKAGCGGRRTKKRDHRQADGVTGRALRLAARRANHKSGRRSRLSKFRSTHFGAN